MKSASTAVPGAGVTLVAQAGDGQRRPGFRRRPGGGGGGFRGGGGAALEPHRFVLLCLDRDQRVAYVLGEIFEAPSKLAGEVLGISPAAFRKRLERSRRDLVAFMNEQCGLVDASNPCRCERKTRAFIEAGWVDPRWANLRPPFLPMSAEDGAKLAAELHNEFGFSGA